MSKFGARRKNPPTGRLKSADGMEEAPAANPESGAPEMSPGEKNWTEQEEETAAGGASALPPEAGSTVAGQLQLLLQAMAQLSATITEVRAWMHSPGPLSEWERQISANPPPATFEIGANTPNGCAVGGGHHLGCDVASGRHCWCDAASRHHGRHDAALHHGCHLSSHDEDEDLITQTAPGMVTPEDGGEALLAEQSTVWTRLAELLRAAASILAELHPVELGVEKGATEPRGDEVSTTFSRQAGTSVVQPALVAAIFSEGRSAGPAKSEAPLKSPVDIPSLRRRLPFVKEFTAASGGWVAFKRQFLTNADLAGWTEVEALRALPAALNDDALVMFLIIPPSEKATLTQTL
ncbi:unnamed protein product [Lampetra fluviatilis]